MSSESITPESEEIKEFVKSIEFLKDLVQEATYDSFLKVINYYDQLINMKHTQRSEPIYGLMSTYGLLLLNSTYDLSVKEIFRTHMTNSLNDKENIQQYLREIFDNKILNRYLTNIKHKTVKETFSIPLDGKDATLQQSVTVINLLIDTRNKIAHGLETSSKGHNDLYEALSSVIYYLNWYSIKLKEKFCN